MEKVYVYCDEFGTSTLNKNDKKNITKFVYSSIIIKESHLTKARSVRDEISKNFFSGQKIKSSKLSGRNRVECLKYLCENLTFINHFLIVDKEQLDKEEGGLKFRKVFYKYFQKIFIREISSNFSDFRICMHQIIDEQYGIQLKKYLSQKIKNNLFENYHILSDEDEPLIQLADLLAGSYGRCLNKDYHTEHDELIIDLISPNVYSYNFFPEESKGVHLKYSNNKMDKEVYNIVRFDAYSEYKSQKDEFVKSIISLLLMRQKMLPFNYVQLHEIINHVNYYTNKVITKESLRIYLRDLRLKGILVVSSNNKSGYKLAVSKEDIGQYFNHYSKYILPMLQKVKIANEIFMKETVGEYIPLNNFQELQIIINSLKGKI